MAEFGHVGIIGENFCIDAWGSGPFLMKVGGKVERFEDSDRFGPSRLNAKGEILDYWPERHPFWRQHREWVKQGRKVSPDGTTCVWEPTQYNPTFWYRDGRRKIVLEYGDEGGPSIEVPKPPLLTITIGDAGEAAAGTEHGEGVGDGAT